MRWRKVILILLLTIHLPGLTGYAQQPITLTDSLRQHIFTHSQIEQLEDSTGLLAFDDIRSPAYTNQFKPSLSSTPRGKVTAHAYWYRIKINHDPAIAQRFFLEFFDQTIDDIVAYLPDGAGGFDTLLLGDKHVFESRIIPHKNFVIPLAEMQGEQTYYFRIQSSQVSDVIVVLRAVDFFVGYALGEYFSFGLFYGMILIFCFYNLIMFFAVRQTAYLYYVFYMLCVALFELCTDGVAYHYLWPNAASWNQYAFGVVLFGMSISALMFTKKLFYVRKRAPWLNNVLNGIIAVRVAYFVYGLMVDKSLFNYKFLEAIPLIACFSTGIYMWASGYRHARYFVIGYGILFFGYLVKLLILLGFSWLNFGVVSYYILSFCFILEMTFLSLAAGDRLRVLKKRKDRIQLEMIKQMRENEELKDSLNRRLEEEVNQRTAELRDANALLNVQKEEIARMNALLQQDNEQLQNDMEHVTHARLMSTDVDFEEFRRVFPDQESCFGFIAEFKWADGYACRKCKHTHYYTGHLPYSRRCASCGYEESAIAYTLLQNSRIPINKAFYLIYLVYSSKGRISSRRLSEHIGIRQSTCWAYQKKVLERMEQKRSLLHKRGNQGWSLLLN